MFSLFLELSRPFTLLFPFVAAFSGLMMAAGAVEAEYLAMGIFAGAVLVIVHAAANIFNQVFDREIDAVNKPTRPIPGGRITARSALAASIVLYLAGLILSPFLGVRFFGLVLLYAVLTVVYSAPPRLKRFPWLSNLTIAVARGMLILMAGYAAVKPLDRQIWAVSSVLGLYLLGAASTKDFVEIKGDRAFGIRTLPVVYGVEKTVRMILPFFILPFLLVPVYCHFSVLRAPMIFLTAFVLMGAVTVGVMLRHPSEHTFTENSLSWVLMYLTIILYPVTAMVLEFT